MSLILYWATIIIFIASYLIIISEKINRTVIALTGAILLIVIGAITQKNAIEGVDFNTLGLLIGMMVIVGISKQSGMFQAIAIWASKLAKGKPIVILVFLSIITAVFSALLDNVTTVLLIVPVVFVIANNLKLKPKIFLIATILLSNIGGAATLIGDPPNILIGSAANLSFNDFLFNLGPIALITAFVTLAIIFFFYRKKLKTTKKARKAIMKFKPKEAISNKALLIKSLIVFGIVLIGFLTHSITHIEGATIALGGAALLLLLTLTDPEKYLREVEWSTIFFFIGLFIMVTGLEHIGVIELLAQKLMNITGGNLTATAMAILWGSAFFSSIVDNIPYVATMIPLIQDIGAISALPLLPLWWSLALGADIGGNATLVGASSNVIVSGLAEREGQKIGFVEYMKTAIPLTLIGLVICSIYVWIRYLS